MGTKLLFWLVFYPLSILPLPILYGIAYIFYLICNYLLHYRRKVIDENLRNAFLELTQKERNILRKKYYHHLAQLAAEMLKMLTMSKKQLKKRYFCTNPELVNRYFEQGRSVILMSSHYNNWEWMVLSLDSQFLHHGVGVGKPNSNKIFEKLINRARTRYGTEVVFADTVRQTFEQNHAQKTPAAYMMLSDQSTSNIEKSYITTFMNQPSDMIYGSEYFAKKYDLPVLYYSVIKDKIGCYHIDIQLITENPKETPYGEICNSYVQKLEATIRRQPEFWLWSHRRWKHKTEIERKLAQHEGDK